MALGLYLFAQTTKHFSLCKQIFKVMRKIILALTIIIFSTSFGAYSTDVVPADTIMLISGRKVAVNVQGVTASSITYIPLESNEVKDIDRKQVHRIIYRNGRVESFNDLAVMMVDEGDWKTVILTDNLEDVEGLFALGEADGKSSPQSRNAKAAQRSADIRLKKRAVNMGGIVVYITHRESKGGYGETPTHFVKGIVYGFEPPEQ